MVGKKVVPIELAEAKIRAACAERLNPETWILARTDARAVYDLDEALRGLADNPNPRESATEGAVLSAASGGCAGDERDFGGGQ